jgi:hypothetical protein
VSDHELDVMWEESNVAYFKVINRLEGLNEGMKYTNKYIPPFTLCLEAVLCLYTAYATSVLTTAGG